MRKRSSKHSAKAAKHLTSGQCLRVICYSIAFSFSLGVIISVSSEYLSTNVPFFLIWQDQSRIESYINYKLLRVEREMRNTMYKIEQFSRRTIEDPEFLRNLRQPKKFRNPKTYIPPAHNMKQIPLSSEYVPPKRDFNAVPKPLDDIIYLADKARFEKGTTISYSNYYGSIKTNGTYYNYEHNVSSPCEVRC